MKWLKVPFMPTRLAGVLVVSLVVLSAGISSRANDVFNDNPEPGDSWSKYYPPGAIHDPAFPISHLPSRQVTVISEDGESSTRDSLPGQDIRVWKPKTTAPANSRTLRVLAYNVHGLPTPIVADGGRYAEIGKRLAARRKLGTQPDIVALQEAFSNGAQELVKNAGYKHVIWGPLSPGGITMKGGIVLLTDLPVLESAIHTFSRCYSFDCVAQKGIEFVRVQLPGAFFDLARTQPVTLDIYDNHMNSNLDGDPFSDPAGPADTRLSQVQEVREFIEAHSESWRPVIFPGDFNMRPREYEMLSLMTFLGVSDASDACAVSGTCNPQGGDPRHEYENSVDHQFFRDGVSPDVRMTPVSFARNFAEPFNGSPLSDHLGLEIDYRISW